MKVINLILSTRQAVIGFVGTALLLFAVLLLTPNLASAFIKTTDFPLNANNLVPGMTISGTIELQNTQSTTHEVQIEVTNGASGLLADFIQVNVTGGNSYASTLNDFYSAGAVSLGTVASNQKMLVSLSFTLASTAPASLMGQSTNFDFCIGFKGGDVSCGVAFSTVVRKSSGTRIASRTNSPLPRVLGVTAGDSPATDDVEATAECREYLQAYIRPNAVNNRAEVIKLQTFLRDLGGFPALVATGQYDPATISAVRSFQASYRSTILAPWGIAEPTGFVYYTTRKAINEIHCRFTKLFPLSVDQLREIERVRQAGQAWVPESAEGRAVSTTVISGTDAPTGAVAGVSTNDENSQIQTDATELDSAIQSETETKTDRPSFFKRIWNWLTGWFK